MQFLWDLWTILSILMRNAKSNFLNVFEKALDDSLKKLFLKKVFENI